MLGVTVSAIILAPIAIGVSVYLISHPSFFIILEEKDDFGVFLIVMLTVLITISGIWLYTGIRQYASLSNWNHRYGRYLKKKQELDSQIASEYNLEEENQT